MKQIRGVINRELLRTMLLHYLRLIGVEKGAQSTDHIMHLSYKTSRRFKTTTG